MPGPLPIKVTTVNATEFPQRLAYIALHADYSEEPFPKTELPEDEAGRIVVERLLKGGRGHWGPLEHPSLSLMIQADHNTMMQLRTHRVGCTFDYQSMRYTGKRISKVANHEIPPEDVFYVRPPGKYTDSPGSATAQPTCEACVIGFFKALSSNSSNATDSCTAHTKCPPGKYTTAAGSSTSQPTCGACATGFFKSSFSQRSTCVGSALPPGNSNLFTIG